MRYGENPHQKAALLRHRRERGRALPPRRCCRASSSPTTTSTTPTPPSNWWPSSPPGGGPACRHHQACQSVRRRHGPDAGRRLCRALACDSASAFGGIIALNQPLDAGDGRRDRQALHRSHHRARSERRGARPSSRRKPNLRLLDRRPAGSAYAAALPPNPSPAAFSSRRRDNGMVEDLELKVVHPARADGAGTGTT